MAIDVNLEVYLLTDENLMNQIIAPTITKVTDYYQVAKILEFSLFALCNSSSKFVTLGDKIFNKQRVIEEIRRYRKEHKK